MSDEKPLNIFQRINEVRKEVSYIQKDAKVQTYSAISHDMVVAAIRPSLIKHGIVIFPVEQESEMIDTGTETRNGAKIYRYEAKFLIEFVNIDTPSDRVTMLVTSHANDNGDKAPGKAVSYAVKTAELKMFSLETGENDESRVEGTARDVFDEKTLLEFANTMLRAINEQDGHIVIGRANVSQQDIWTATTNGTRSKGTGYYSSAEKKLFKEKTQEYIALMNTFAENISEAVANQYDEQLLESLNELDNDIDKTIVWSKLNDSEKVYIKNMKEAA